MEVAIFYHRSECKTCGHTGYWKKLSDFSYGEFLVLDDQLNPVALWDFSDKIVDSEINNFLGEKNILKEQSEYSTFYNNLLSSIMDISVNGNFFIDPVPRCANCGDDKDFDFFYPEERIEMVELSEISFVKWKKLSEVEKLMKFEDTYLHIVNSYE